MYKKTTDDGETRQKKRKSKQKQMTERSKVAIHREKKLKIERHEQKDNCFKNGGQTKHK